MRQKYKGEDIKARLHHTIIRYDSVPYLADVNPSGTINLMDLTTGSLFLTVSSEDERLDISSINIGFVNIIHPDYKLAVYLKREPYRKFKQGIELASLTQKVLRTGMSSIPVQIIQSKSFIDAVLGKFPTYKEAIDLIERKSFKSVAISRDIAIKHEGEVLKVFLKDTEVGFIRHGTHRVQVPKTEQSYYYMVLLEEIKGWDVVEGVK